MLTFSWRHSESELVATHVAMQELPFFSLMDIPFVREFCSPNKKMRALVPFADHWRQCFLYKRDI